MMPLSLKARSRLSVTKPLTQAVVAWGIGLVIAVIIGIDRSGWWMLPLFTGGAVAGLLVWRGYRWPDNWSSYLSFGGILLLALIANRFLYIADFFVSGEKFSAWPFFSSAPDWAILKAEIITIAGTLITVSVWLFAGGAEYSPRLLLTAPRPFLIRAFVVIYALSGVGLTISQLNPDDSRALGQLPTILIGLGIASSFFLPIAIARTRPAALGIAGLLSIPFVYFSLLSGMKENIIISLVPVAYLAWLVARNAVARLTIVALAFLIVSVITPFVGYYRSEAWQGERELNRQEAFSEFTDIAKAKGTIETMSSGLEAFVSRSNASVHRGWAISLADEYGYEPELVFLPMLYVFVPRVLWPEKPLIQQGRQYSGLVFGQQYVAWSSSSTAAGLYPAFYLGYGWPAVFAGAVCIGLMVAGLFKLAWRIGGPLMVGLYGFSLLPFALRMDETWTVGAISSPVIGFVYLIGVLLVVRLASAVMKIS